MNPKELHERYKNGERDFSGADLAGANLAGTNLAGALLAGANLPGADLAGANLAGADLAGANLAGANLAAASGYRYCDAPDPLVLRELVAAHIERHPDLHDQRECGDGSPNHDCDTPCCVAGWACHLGGGRRGDSVATAATRLLWVDGRPMPSFLGDARREEILAALRGLA